MKKILQATKKVGKEVKKSVSDEKIFSGTPS
jgi:hypothetical protein